MQARLADNRQGTRTRIRAAHPNLLAGKLVDDAGEPPVASHATKGNTRYRYYISRGLADGTAPHGSRIPALEIEVAVTRRLAEAFDHPVALASSAWAQLTPTSAAALTNMASEIAGKLRQRHRATAQALIARATLTPHAIEIDCVAAAIADALGLTLAPDAAPTSCSPPPS